MWVNSCLQLLLPTCDMTKSRCSSPGRVALSSCSCSVGHSCFCWWVTVLQLQEHPLLKGVISSLLWLLGLLRVNVLELDQFKKNLIDERLAPL